MTQESFSLTKRQREALQVIGSEAMHVMLFGGSRSGKTFLDLRAIIVRASAAAGSRHAVLRFRFNHVKASIVHDTFPKMMRLCFPDIQYRIDKTDWFAELSNGSQIWFGGLDDKERTEKILGQEYATIYLNECSQIPFNSRNLALTRLAQKCSYQLDGKTHSLRLKVLYDCNPPSQAHWSYKLFVQKRDPESNQPLPDPDNYASLQMNPKDNTDNLPPEYLKTLESMSPRMRKRFLEGKFADVTENALFASETIDKWRTTNDLPDMQRIVVAVDPSGSGDEDNQDNDAIGIVVAGLGTDGNGYLLEDLTVKAGPKVWGNIVATAFDRHQADIVVGETNYGGEMVKFVVQTAKQKIPFKKITASRGKVVRAEPISSLADQGKIRHAGTFVELEDELCAFTTAGYIGNKSPNRGDAYVWAFSELFPGIVKEPKKEEKRTKQHVAVGPQGWMG